MKSEILFDGTKVDKIGFGTWRIGGKLSANSIEDDRSMKALRSALDLGYTHFDTAEMYGQGHSEELLGKAIRLAGVDRENLFIATKVLPSNLGYNNLKTAFENSLKRLQMDYIDLYLIHWAVASMPLEEAFQAMNKLVEVGKIRYLGVSNFSVSQMRYSQELSNTPIITNQVPYSITERRYVANGVLEYCQENNIILTAYSPVEEGKLKINSTIQTIAENHGTTTYQIALAWLIQQPKVITIPMSFNPKHQAENLQSVQIGLSEEEMEALHKIA